MNQAEEQRQAQIKRNSHAIVCYFFSAWKHWEGLRNHRLGWQERSSLLNTAHTHLYIALELAGLSMPRDYRLEGPK